VAALGQPRGLPLRNTDYSTTITECGGSFRVAPSGARVAPSIANTLVHLCAMPASPARRQPTGNSVKFATATRPPNGNIATRGGASGEVTVKSATLPRRSASAWRSSGVSCAVRFWPSTWASRGSASENTTSLPPPASTDFRYSPFPRSSEPAVGSRGSPLSRCARSWLKNPVPPPDRKRQSFGANSASSSE